ncbi:putative alkaline phosphatase-like protein [Diaporthe ampelina]|uniref:Putative alkaline phosphatase-like protein n=1 Tax=Diaporthe ampelina TaxID=1214573 RepID=A0A0G2F6D2_9PEZI|nr:putative alkaline phosphatase-like protein [Diaporthe ampelina]
MNILKRGNIAYSASELSFTHGIASGDPYPDSVILWTRIAPSTESDASNVTVEGTVPVYNHDTETYIEADANPICVEWTVWRQTPENGTNTNETYVGPAVSTGTAYTTSDIDYTVKVEADGLQPWTTYNYQFTVCGSDNSSPIGRTKTSPASDADIDEVNLAVFSCSNYPNGYFNVYGNAARKDGQDYVVHVGDYIYEGAAGGIRGHQPPRLLFSLFDYRTRHGQYRRDPDLQLLAQNHAWITTWDDHEVANNGYRDGFSALNNTEESFRNDGPSISVDQRKMNAVRAYFEWMPIRQVDLDNNLRIWRSFQMGNLLDLIVIDTRNYDRSITDLGWNTDYIQLLRNDASRRATYRVVANQIVFSRIVEDNEPDGDNWEAYAANRNRTLKHLYDNSIPNTIFLAGDSHQNWVSDLAWLETKPYDAADGDGAIGVEFAGTAVSSTGNRGLILDTQADAQAVVEENESLQWQDGYYRGYFVLTLTPERATAQYFGSPSVASRNPWDLSLANFTMEAGANRLKRPVAGGTVEAGFLRGGETVHTNLTLNTETGEYEVIGFETMYLTT